MAYNEELASLMKERYIGDGLYVSHNGYYFVLRAPREDGDHVVYLEEPVLAVFMRYVEEIERHRKGSK